ncbi:MAG TPA: inositol monophosphatase family protein, partial [Gemmatimonadaceae bacterium]|nr:inositol monophosphatase family protein [Gemmatimonadaceae bacterium]
MQGITVTDRDDAELLDIALDAARAAAKVIRAATANRGRLVWEPKGRSDFVSDVDKDAEHSIAEIVARRCPGASVLGEELSPLALSDGEIVFIADPLDGTTNFLHGYPEYATSIGVARNGELRAAVVLNVPRGDEFTARKGAGAWRDGDRIRVSTQRDPARALIGTGFPFKTLELLPRYQKQFSLVMQGTAGIRRAGAAALDLASVACGRFDAFWELTLSPWDVAGGILLIQEAGGVVTDLDGNPSTLTAGAYVAGNPAMHAWLVQTVRRADMTT